MFVESIYKYDKCRNISGLTTPLNEIGSTPGENQSGWTHDMRAG